MADQEPGATDVLLPPSLGENVHNGSTTKTEMRLLICNAGVQTATIMLSLSCSRFVCRARLAHAASYVKTSEPWSNYMIGFPTPPSAESRSTDDVLPTSSPTRNQTVVVVVNEGVAVPRNVLPKSTCFCMLIRCLRDPAKQLVACRCGVLQ